MVLSHQPRAPQQAPPAEAAETVSAGRAVLVDVRAREGSAVGLPVVAVDGVHGRVV